MGVTVIHKLFGMLFVPRKMYFYANSDFLDIFLSSPIETSSRKVQLGAHSTKVWLANLIATRIHWQFSPHSSLNLGFLAILIQLRNVHILKRGPSYETRWMYLIFLMKKYYKQITNWDDHLYWTLLNPNTSWNWLSDDWFVYLRIGRLGPEVGPPLISSPWVCK